ncbi:MAG: hemerythrin domain-containing protein [Rhizobacter sp.]|nr:hemerythrin domain-containing protein [Bacteriovorax sp.]
MSYETETLRLLRQSLDEEDDETSIISVLEHHHKYLREYMSILTGPEISPEHKQATLYLFFPIFNMHAKAEQDTLYRLLQGASNHEVRLEGLRGLDEHEIAFEIIRELQEMGAETSWSDEIDAKIHVLAGLIKGHIKEEENAMYPLVERHFSESKLMDLTDNYLEKCKIYLDMEMESVPSAVSRSDVLTFFY